MGKTRLVLMALAVSLPPFIFTGQVLAQGDLNQTSPQSHGVLQYTDVTSQPSQATNLAIGREAQFISLMHARDGQVSHLAELRRMLSFHDEFNASLQRMWSNFSIPDYKGLIAKEQKRLERFAAAISKSSSLPDKQSLAASFDDTFPLTFRSRTTPLRNAQESATSTDIWTFIPAERTAIQNLSQTLSVEARTYSIKYETILTDLEGKARSVWQPPSSSLNDLPDNFNDLEEAHSIKEMSEDQISGAIGKYRMALSQAGDTVANMPQVQNNEIRDSIVKQLAQINADLRAEYASSTKAFDGYENGIVRTATITFGNAVGSSSFTYLLIVFAAVFVMIMLFPVLYKRFDSNVATNLIRSEFLLQLSTVFVLTSAIIILGIGQFIDRSQLPVFLAGISGYVLGQLGKSSTPPPA